MRLLVKGGAGYIGSAFVRLAPPEICASRLNNVDKLTYAGNLENPTAVKKDIRYRFVQSDTGDLAAMTALLAGEQPHSVVHFAAESHVDRSILGPAPFIEANLYGTFVLLGAARAHGLRRYLHVSTEAVYGSIAAPYHAKEEYQLKPSSPYSVSQAAPGLLALSYQTTFQLPGIVTRASEKFRPLSIPGQVHPLDHLQRIGG